MARPHLFALLLAASCAAPAPPPSPPPAPPTVVIAAPTATPTTITETPEPRVVLPDWEPKEPPAPPDLLAKLTADQQATLALLTPLCPTAVNETDGKLTAGCTCCPNACGPAHDPRTRVVGGEVPLVEPYSRVSGAFTVVGKTEHLVFMDTCTCNGCPNMAWLLAPDGKGGYSQVAQQNLLNAGACKVVRRKGQVDRVLCQRGMARMGYASTTLHLYDFSRDFGKDTTDLTPVFEFVALDNFILSCGPGAHYLSRTLDKWELRDTDNDGEDDLVVDLTVADGTITKRLLEVCSDESGNVPTKGAFPKERAMKLIWTATPQGFAPDAKTKKLLAQLDAAAAKAKSE